MNSGSFAEKQGDFLSILFSNSVLQSAMEKHIDICEEKRVWASNSMMKKSDCISNLRFADDVLTTVASLKQLKTWLRVFIKYRSAGTRNPPRPNPNLHKPEKSQNKRSRDRWDARRDTSSWRKAKYLGQMITFVDQENAEIQHRIWCALSAFARHRQELTSQSNLLRHRILQFDAVVTPTIMHTHSLVVRTFFCCTVCLRTSAHLHACAPTSMAQVMSQGCLLHMCHTSPSRHLPLDDSPISIVPARSLRDQSRLRFHWLRHPRDLAVFSRPRSTGHAPFRTSIVKLGYLARSDANTGYEPEEFDKIASVDDDAMLINDPNHNFSDFSKTHEREHKTIRCPHDVWILCFARFSWWFLFFR